MKSDWRVKMDDLLTRIVNTCSAPEIRDWENHQLLVITQELIDYQSDFKLVTPLSCALVVAAVNLNVMTQVGLSARTGTFIGAMQLLSVLAKVYHDSPELDEAETYLLLRRDAGHDFDGSLN